MPAYHEPDAHDARRQRLLVVGFLIAALTVFYLPEAGQQPLAWALRETVLRPFIAIQHRLVESRLRSREVTELQRQVDSLASALATQQAVADENRSLRALMLLGARAEPAFRPTSVLRPGTLGSESVFLIELGEEDGIEVGAPVVDASGLLGVIREVRPDMSIGIDWTHPDFRASAMLADGSAFGMVETRRSVFRENDRLVLNGTAYYEAVPVGVPVLTSGLGGVFPRGIPIGTVDGVAEVEGRWRKSYWLRPAVQPGAVTHVLVGVGPTGSDLGALWGLGTDGRGP